MAFETGTILSVDEFYDALIIFMTANGWAVLDTIPGAGGRDKVLFSQGVNNDVKMYYRVSSNTAGFTAIKDPTDTHVSVPHIIFRGYHNWNVAAHSGNGEFGQIGPLLFEGDNANNGIHHVYPFESKNATTNSGTLIQPIDPTIYRWTGTPSNGGLAGCTSVHDGNRKMYIINDSGVGLYDLASGEGYSVSAGLSIARSFGTALIKDVNADKEYPIISHQTTGQLFRFDLETGTYQTLAPNPWNTSTAGGNLVWDGGDFIYLLRGNSLTDFARYSISSNSWTSLAATPVGVPYSLSNSNYSGAFRNVYIPNSVTGIGQDVIYAHLLDSASLIYRYDVTSNAWRSTTGTGALAVPSACTTASGIVWDKVRYLYFLKPVNNLRYRSDLSTTPGTFVDMGTLAGGGITTLGATVLNFMCSKLRCNNFLPGKYFFHGNADGFRIVSRIGTSPGNGRYYWAYIGKYETANNPASMGLTSAASAGVRVTVNVNTTASFAVGQPVVFSNYSGSHFETSSIYAFPSSTTLQCNLTSSFPSGSVISVDNAQHLLGGDSGFACIPASYYGYQKDVEADYYLINPVFNSTDMANHAPSSRGSYMPSKMMIYNNLRGVVAYAAAGYTRKYETLGFLKNLFSLNKKVFPSPQNEDILVFGNEQYIFFNFQHVARMATNNNGIVIGPI